MKHTRAPDAGSTSSAAKLETGGDVEEEYEYREVHYKDWITKKKYIPWWIALVVIMIVVALMAIYHEQIVAWLKPVSAKIRSLSWGWVIPILVLILLSFPPLFGHEIVAILCGVVYGLWIGFGIVAAGTFLGEIATYFLFKYVLRRRAEKLEKTNLNYAALARITRDGGFIIVFIIRLSVIPSHFSTAVFSTCGVSFWIFLIATLVTLPKQLVVVYLGVIISNPGKGKLISDVVLGLTFIVTVIAAIWIWWKMRKIRPILLQEQATRKSMKQQLLHSDSNPVRRDHSFEAQELDGGNRSYKPGQYMPAHREDAYEMDAAPYGGGRERRDYRAYRPGEQQEYAQPLGQTQYPSVQQPPYGQNQPYPPPPPPPPSNPAAQHRPYGADQQTEYQPHYGSEQNYRYDPNYKI